MFGPRSESTCFLPVIGIGPRLEVRTGEHVGGAQGITIFEHRELKQFTEGPAGRIRILPHLRYERWPVRERQSHDAVYPAGLAGQFVIASVVASAVLWSLAGLASGWLYQRLSRSG